MKKPRRKKRKRALTQKRENFCLKFVETGNGREAYAFAFSTKNMALASVDKEVQKLKNDPLVSRRLAELRAAAAEAARISVKSCIDELAKIALFNPKDLYDTDGKLIPIPDLPDDVAAAISSVEVANRPDGEGGFREVVKYKLYSKVTAWDNIQRYLELFKTALKDKEDKVIKITVDVRKPAADDIPSEFITEGEPK